MFHLVLVFLFCVVAYAADGQERDKKLINYGWDSMSPDQLEEKVEGLQHLPFDGLSVRTNHYGHAFYNRGNLEPETVEARIETMSQIPWGKFTDNFMCLNAGANNQWFDDQAWSEDGHIIRNLRALAQMGQAGQCKGIIFDPEFIHWESEAGPWHYGHQALSKEKSLDEYRAMVRKRGAEFIDTIEAEMPNPVFLTFFWCQYGLKNLAYDDDPKLVSEILGGEEFGLLHDFMLGVLDGADPGTRIIDGNEPSYYATTPEAYLEANDFVHNAMLNIIPKDLHNKYREQVSIAHAVYTDIHDGSRDKHYLSTYMTPAERAMGLERIIYMALKYSDQYVWMYTQKPRYLHNQYVAPEMIPAIERAKRKVAMDEPIGFDFAPIEKRAAVAYRRAESAPIRPLTTPVPRTTASSPHLDGKLDDALWEGAKPLGPFRKFLTGPHPVKSKAKAYMTYDETNLYVAFRCDLNEPRSKFDATEIDLDNEQRGRGDLLEIGIATDAEASAYYHIRLTYHNHRWDSITPAGRDGKEIGGQDDSWDGDYQTATYADPDLKFWSAELVISWAELGRSAPKRGERIKGNLIMRTDKAPSHGSYQLVSWSPMRSNRVIEAGTLGTWVFQ